MSRRAYAAMAIAVTVGASGLFTGVAFAVAPAAAPVPNVAPDPASGVSAATSAVRAQPLVKGTPCSTAARACVDLDSQRAWLITDGKVTRGPVKIASGGKTEPTPVGHDLHVYLKDEHHVSHESFTNGVADAMPYSVFFERGGIAFHEGDPENASGGCIHLSSDDAEAFFSTLQMGDDVQVVNASTEYAARGMKYKGATYGFGGVRAWEAEHDDD